MVLLESAPAERQVTDDEKRKFRAARKVFSGNLKLFADPSAQAEPKQLIEDTFWKLKPVFAKCLLDKGLVQQNSRLSETYALVSSLVTMVC